MARARFVLALLPVLWPACTIDFDRFSQASSIATDAGTPANDAGAGDEDASAGQQDAAPDSGPAKDSGPAIDSGQSKDDPSKPLDAGRDPTPPAYDADEVLRGTIRDLAIWACLKVWPCEGELGAEKARALAQMYCHIEVVARGALLAKLRKALKAGEVEIDINAAIECSDQLVEDDFMYCDADLRGPPSSEACARWLTGTLEEGENCALDAQCAPGLLCANESEHCPGICQRGVQGDSCSATADCDHDYACVDGVCVARAGAGLPCVSHDECASGLFGATGGRCEVKRVEGEDCLGSDSVSVEQASCESGLLCVDSEPGVKPPHCDAVGNPIGEPCSANLPCDYGARCIAGVCRAAASLQSPWPSLTSAPFHGCDSQQECPEGYYCADRVECTQRPLVGDICPGECYEGLCKEGWCVLGVEGDPCDPLQHGPLPACAGYCADDGHCAARLGAGESCDRDEQCNDGLVCAGPAQGKTCSAPVCD